MKRRTLPILLAIVAGGALGVDAVRQTRPPQPHPDVQPLRHRHGVALTNLIPSGRTEATIEKDEFPPLIAQPPQGVGQLEWITSLSEFVFVVRVTRIQPQLTSAQDWITSTISAEVETVAKQPTGDSVGPGTTISFTQEGGELLLSGTLVRAMSPWAQALEVKERYLLFARRSPSGAWLVSLLSSYRIDGTNKLNTLLRDRTRFPKVASENAIGIAEAMKRVRSVKS